MVKEKRDTSLEIKKPASFTQSPKIVSLHLNVADNTKLMVQDGDYKCSQKLMFLFIEF